MSIAQRAGLVYRSWKGVVELNRGVSRMHLHSGTLRVLALCVAIFSGMTALAQVTGRVSGTVVDPTGDVIAGAEVTVINQRTGDSLVTRSGSQGAFVFPNVNPGQLTVRVQMDGFSVHERTNLVLNANQSLTLGDIQLSIGTISERVEVVGQGAMVQTDNSGSTSVLTDKQMQGLMQRGRDVVALLTVVPGTSSNTSSDALGGNWGTETPNMQGMRSHWNAFALDGQPGADIDALSFFTLSVSMDAVEEVSVKAASFLAEDGRSPGAKVNIISKSGTKEFHGSAYYFKRHESLNANNFFNNRLGVGRPANRYETFGGVLGGPIFIPGKFNTSREKVFFTLSREDWRVMLPGPLLNTTLPTALERQGNFSSSFDQNGALIPVLDPLANAAPFANNIIPTNRINVFGRNMLAWHPDPNFFDQSISRGAFNYRFQERRRQPKQQTQLKFDLVPTASDRIFFRPRWWVSDLQGQAQSTAFGGNFFAQPHRYKYRADAYAGGYTKTISPTVINDFNISWSKVQELGTMDDEFDLANVRRETHGLAGLGQLFPSANPLNLIPQMSFGGLPNSPNTSFDPRTPISAGDTRTFMTNNVSWVKANHTLKFGVFFEQNVASEGPRAAGGGHMGQFTFNRDRNNPLDSNHPFANAILGNFLRYQESSTQSNGQARMHSFEFFAQDQWRVNRRLNIDMGIRFYSFIPWRYNREIGAALSLDRYQLGNAPLFYQPARNSNGRRVSVNPVTGALAPEPLIGAFAPNSGNPLNGVVLVGDPNYPDGFRERPPLQAAPRMGFALDVFGTGKTVIRGGAGIAKQTVFSSQNSMWTTTTAPPFVESPSIFFGTIDTFLNAGQQVVFPTDISSFERQFDNVPTVVNWLFGVQQDIGFGTVLDVSYAGNTGRWLRQNRNLNTLPPGARFAPGSNDPTTNRPLPDAFLRPYRGFQNISYVEDSGYSNYHSLQVAVNRRYASGFQYGVAYTYSKAMGISGQDGGGLPMFRDYRSYLYGKLPFDQTHNLVFNYLYSVPNAAAFANQPILRGMFHNWEVAGISTYASGFPNGVGYSFIDGIDRLGGGDAPRVNIVDRPTLGRGDRDFFRWFNVDAVAAPITPGDFGNAPRDVFRGPGIANWDVSVNKNFPIREALRLQFRWEFYNFFNHTQFSAVDSNARFDGQGRQVNGQFGQVVGARAPREMQLSLRLEF